MFTTALETPSSKFEIKELTGLSASHTAVLARFGSPKAAQDFADGFTVQFICGVAKWYDAQPITLGGEENAIWYAIPEEHWDRKAALRMLAVHRATRERVDVVVPLLAGADAPARETQGRVAARADGAAEARPTAGEMVLAVRRPSTLCNWLVAAAFLLGLAHGTAAAAPEPGPAYRVTTLGAKALLGAIDEQARYAKLYPKLGACFTSSRDRTRAAVLQAYFRATLVETDGRWRVDGYAVTGATVDASPRGRACLLGLAIAAYVWRWENEGRRADPATMVGLYQVIVAFAPALDVPFDPDLVLNSRYLRRLLRASSPALRRHWEAYVAQVVTGNDEAMRR